MSFRAPLPGEFKGGWYDSQPHFPSKCPPGHNIRTKTPGFERPGSRSGRLLRGRLLGPTLLPAGNQVRREVPGAVEGAAGGADDDARKDRLADDPGGTRVPMIDREGRFHNCLRGYSGRHGSYNGWEAVSCVGKWGRRWNPAELSVTGRINL